MDELVLNQDLTISKNGKTIAAYSADTGNLLVLKGFGGNKKGGIVKLLKEADLDVEKTVTVETLMSPEVAAERAKAKAPERVSVAKKTVTRRPEPEEDPEDNRWEEELSEKDREIAELKTKLKQAERDRKEASFRPGVPIPKNPKNPDGSPMTPKQMITAFGPEDDPASGDKTPRVIQWAKDNLTDEQYAEVYGHRVIPD
jgi:hypothetical protein